MHAVPLECLVTWDRGAGRSERTVVWRRHAGGRGQPPETGRAGAGVREQAATELFLPAEAPVPGSHAL